MTHLLHFLLLLLSCVCFTLLSFDPTLIYPLTFCTTLPFLTAPTASNPCPPQPAGVVAPCCGCPRTTLTSLSRSNSSTFPTCSSPRPYALRTPDAAEGEQPASKCVPGLASNSAVVRDEVLQIWIAWLARWAYERGFYALHVRSTVAGILPPQAGKSNSDTGVRKAVALTDEQAQASTTLFHSQELGISFTLDRSEHGSAADHPPRKDKTPPELQASLLAELSLREAALPECGCDRRRRRHHTNTAPHGATESARPAS